jgi:EmrB/QacA subfamily drug resistance transporter
VLLFALASFVGGFAQNQAWLLSARAAQGVGGAIASPTALSLIATTFEEGTARNRAFGIYAAVSGAGAAIGLILGGVLTDLLSWRWVLFVNAPIGLLIAMAAPRLIPETERRDVGALDVPGALASTGGMALLVYGFIHAASDGWRDRITGWSFAGAAALLAIFFVVEVLSRRPLMPMRLFRNRTRVGSLLVMLILGAAVFAMFYFLTQYIQQVKGFSPIEAGFAFLPVSAVIVTMAQIASRVMHRIGSQPLIIFGTIAVGFGLLLLSKLSVNSSYAGHVLPGILLIAGGMGSIFVPITVTAVRGVAPEDSGIASAMLNVAQQVGGTVGLSSLVTVATHAARHAVPTGRPPQSLTPTYVAHFAFTHGAVAAFRVGAIFALAGLVVGLVFIRDDKVADDAKVADEVAQ